VQLTCRGARIGPSGGTRAGSFRPCALGRDLCAGTFCPSCSKSGTGSSRTFSCRGGLGCKWCTGTQPTDC